ncbi:MAG TPA: efflux RND transporter periplasmic adaptor subunit [Bacillota bacterium]|nr:efflux RND transporter periplasmic adaptor subunit [Bacillota bacterium]
MRKKILVALMMGVMLMTAACGKAAADVSADEAPAPEPEKAIEAFGVVEANSIENISLDIEAEIAGINVKEGQQVKKGDILLSIDMKAYQEKIKSRQHELEIIRLEAKKLDNAGSNPDMEKLENDLKYANEQLEKASKELEAQLKLYESGAISKYEYDGYAKAAEAKRKNAEDIKYQLDGLMHINGLGLAIQNEKAAAAESEIRQMKSKINRSFISGNNIICTVENGIVYDIGYKAGDKINPEKKLLSLMDMDTIVVKADVAEEFIKDVKPGAGVEIIPAADKSRQYHGKIAAIAKKAVEKNGETVIPVEISIDDKDSFLLPNFNVDVRIFTE